MQITERAEKIYNRVHVSEQQVRIYGEENLRKSHPVALATITEIAEWLQNIEDARSAAGLNWLDEEKIPFGISREEIFTIADNKRKSAKKRAGVRALVAKYGKEDAEKIIQKKTGRSYNLRG